MTQDNPPESSTTTSQPSPSHLRRQTALLFLQQFDEDESWVKNIAQFRLQQRSDKVAYNLASELIQIVGTP